MRGTLRIAICAVVVAVCCMMPTAASAGPSGCRTTKFHATSFHLLVAGNSFNGAPVKFYNYDFGTPTCARANNVEWPADNRTQPQEAPACAERKRPPAD
jgi:hypothetical protein